MQPVRLTANRQEEWCRHVSVCLPFSTTTTSSSAPPAITSFSSSAALQVGGSSPSNSWFTSPCISDGLRSPSLLETVNLWLMAVAWRVAFSSDVMRQKKRGGGRRKNFGSVCVTGPVVSSADRDEPLVWLFCRGIRCVIPTGPSHQPVSARCLQRVWVLEPIPLQPAK